MIPTGSKEPPDWVHCWFQTHPEIFIRRISKSNISNVYRKANPSLPPSRVLNELILDLKTDLRNFFWPEKCRMSNSLSPSSSRLNIWRQNNCFAIFISLLKIIQFFFFIFFLQFFHTFGLRGDVNCYLCNWYNVTWVQHQGLKLKIFSCK